MAVKPPLTNQPTFMPSRKVMVGAIAGVITAGAMQWSTKFADQYPEYLAFLNDASWKTFVPLGAMVVAGYVFRERKN